MKVTIEGNNIIVDSSYLDIADTLECGQVFRYTKVSDKCYHIYSLDKHAYASQQGSVTTISCDDTSYWYNYFDLDSDYSIACDILGATNNTMACACTSGKGIRILRQDATETIISFIISANNNISRIRSIIDKICIKLGKATQYGYAFPTIEALANADPQIYTEAGAGYRASYISATAKSLLVDGVPDIDSMSSSQANKMLCQYMGIGPKVADCILLFGYSRGDVVPVDTWIKKVYHNYYECGHRDRDIASYLVSIWGEHAGIAQQYLFHYERKYRQSNNNSVQ